MNETFISYSHRDANFVSEVDQALRENGIDPWIDHEDIPIAVPWKPEMLLGVQFCVNFLYIISPDSVESPYCAEELECALRHNKRIIPVFHRQLSINSLHPSIAELNWVFLNKDFEGNIKKIVSVIESPRGCQTSLTNRKNSIVEIFYDDSLNKSVPLYRNTYWVGRAPQPDSRKAGAIALPDSSLFISRVHLELTYKDKGWTIIDRSRNGFFLYPPSKYLAHGSRIFIGSRSQIVYKEIEEMASEELKDERSTIV